MPRATARRAATKRVTKQAVVYPSKGAGQFYLYAHNPRSRWYNGSIIGSEGGYASVEAAEKDLTESLGEDVDPTSTVILLQNIKEFEMVKEKKERVIVEDVHVLKPKLTTRPTKRAARTRNL